MSSAQLAELLYAKAGAKDTLFNKTQDIQSIGHVNCDVQLTASNVPGFALLAAVQRSHPGVSGSGSIHPDGMLLRCR